MKVQEKLWKNMTEEEKREILYIETGLTQSDHLDHDDLDKIKEILGMNEYGGLL